MNSSQNSETATLDLINQVAFRYFLEKGYEATNLRKISDEVGIKAASIYFYYKSKRELFFHILKEIGEKQVRMMEEVKERNTGLASDEQLYMIFKHVVNDCINNSVEYKFRLRYRMFPAEELTDEIRELYNDWQQKEFNICRTIMIDCLSMKASDEQKNEKFFFCQFRRFLNSIIYEILLSGLVMKEEELYIQWRRFLECAVGTGNVM